MNGARRATESTQDNGTDPVRESCRILEARGTDAEGGRIYRVRLIEAGESRNRRIYPRAVLTAATSLYDGARVYDHHRTDSELVSSTIAGLVGQIRSVEAVTEGLDGDMHLLPSASHVVEAFDASLAAQAAGLPPLVGMSHDVLAQWKPTVTGGRRLREATRITAVHSVDVVADPAAGGRPIRMVAGGSGGLDDDQEVTVNLQQLLALLRAADSAQRAALLAEHADLITSSGLTVTDIDNLAPVQTVDPPAGDPPAGDPPAGDPPAPGTETAPAGELVGAAAESMVYARTSVLGRQLVRAVMADQQVDERMFDTILGQLPERYTEGHVRSTVSIAARFAEGFERAGLAPTIPSIRVTEEDATKKREKLYQTLCRNWREGYSSFFTAYEEITGQRLNPFDGDSAARIVRESWASGLLAGRTRESIDTTTWGEALGDSITRRLIEVYRSPGYADWRRVVRTTPVRDFRTNRRVRVAGYGELPAVGQGGPYQPLTSPTDEEATYAISKRGGTEDLTFEAITNDDLEAVARIPENLARAAAMTLYRFVFQTMIAANPTCTYDSVALFHASHGNTTAVALSNAGANSLRQKMRDQAAYGVSTDILGITPRFLLVPNELEDLANQIANGMAAVPATTPGATDVPNLHRGSEVIVCDHFTDADDWYMIADPAQIPTIELGFLGGQEDPQLLMQDDPRVGAVFSADKVTWRIRHIYSGAVVDHRGFQRGTQ